MSALLLSVPSRRARWRAAWAALLESQRLAAASTAQYRDQSLACAGRPLRFAPDRLPTAKSARWLA